MLLPGLLGRSLARNLEVKGIAMRYYKGWAFLVDTRSRIQKHDFLTMLDSSQGFGVYPTYPAFQVWRITSTFDPNCGSFLG